MSSRRKSFVGVNADHSVETDLSAESLQSLISSVLLPTTENWTTLKGEDKKEQADERGSFSTNNFREYKDSSKPEGLSSVLYRCTVCNFSSDKFDSLSYQNKAQQPDKSLVRFKQIQLESQTILEPTTVPQDTECSVNNMPLVCKDSGKQPTDNRNILEKRLKVNNQMLKDEIRAVSVNGTIIIPEPMSHITSLLQGPPNLSTTPTIAVPLYTNKYNPVLDSNTTLIASFNRFPYPNHAELSWLTAVSKHPEEQIKVWFTTQRLKQGITWSPEEVEEARKKMFNGSAALAHQTCTVLASTELVQPIQPVAQTANSHVIDAPNDAVHGLNACCQPVTATAAGNQTQIVKRSLGTPLLVSEIKWPVIAQTGDLKRIPPPTAPCIAASAAFPESETSCSASSVNLGFKRSVVASFAPPKEKVSMFPCEEKNPVTLPAVLLKERLPLAPLASTNLKRSEVLSSNNKKKLSYSGDLDVNIPSSLAVPHISRPTIIQTPGFSSAVPDCKSLKPSPTVTYSSSQHSKGVFNGDVKSWFLDQMANTQNELQHLSGEFARKNRPVLSQFPLLERVNGKSPGQMKLLEESFQRNSFPSYNELNQLTIITRLSREDIESWFLERRALQDDLEQALLNSMGSKKEAQQKNILVQSPWSSPVESQKGLAHADFGRWFRDSRFLQQGCHNGCRTSQMGQLLIEDNSKTISPEMKDCLSSVCEGWRFSAGSLSDTD